MQADYDPDTLLEEISRVVPFFAGVKWKELGENGKQWPVAQDGTDSDLLHADSFKRGLGKFVYNHSKKPKRSFSTERNIPYIITTNRELEHYNCGAMTRRTGNEKILKRRLPHDQPEDGQTP